MSPSPSARAPPSASSCCSCCAASVTSCSALENTPMSDRPRWPGNSPRRAEKRNLPMQTKRWIRRSYLLAAFLALAIFTLIFTAQTQQRGAVTKEQLAKRSTTEQELESVAIIERKVMVPMRDGKRMATDIYRPKDTSKKYPIIFVRTPYNFNFWDVRNGAPRDMATELAAVKRDYAYVEMNERGHFFSEGIYDILGAPLTEGARQE